MNAVLRIFTIYYICIPVKCQSFRITVFSKSKFIIQYYTGPLSSTFDKGG